MTQTARHGDHPADRENERLVLAKVAECYKRAEDHFGRPFERPPITFKLAGRTAGQYIFKRKASYSEIRINYLLLRHQRDGILSQVVAHEIAHHISRVVYGEHISSHGREWAYVMRDVFDLRPDRCHSMDTTQAVKTAYIYRCHKCSVDMVLGARKHQLAMENPDRYCCKTCRGQIKYLHRLDPVSGNVMHDLSVRGLYIAVDKGWADSVRLKERLSALLRDEKPGKVYSMYPVDETPAIAKWLHRERVIYAGRYSADEILRYGMTKIITHAVSFSVGNDRTIQAAMMKLKNAGVTVRVLQIPN